MRRPVAICLLLLLFTINLYAGIGGKDALYVGGTIPGLKDKTEGKPILTDENAFIFKHKKGSVSIPYTSIDGLEYGQKAGRRVGVAVAVNPLFLFSKKRKHYLTISYLDENKKQQAAVLELGKGIIRNALTVLEAKSGKKVEYQDEEARKSAAN